MDSLSSVDDLLVAINIFITGYIEGFFLPSNKVSLVTKSFLWG